MTDPDVDLGFVYDNQGRTDIPRSTFFDLNLNVDDSVEGYIDNITFTLAPAIEEHLPIRSLWIVGRPQIHPSPAIFPSMKIIGFFFLAGTAVTKLKIAQKEALGVAEKRMGRRGPGSVIGSSAAGCACALLSIYSVGGSAFSEIWRLAFVASFCTKLSDTVSSEIGKAYGKTA
ncbi:hypothetical protein MA16_Dca012423 [Dendrobium catenatum]|uniref:Uncharacterized protein n=1 Tax=Dendrobium catenatum TaxID=906689 RepID=A0A2I0WYD4_9ASPA|nr:hypothetical protein MA16_Dca012423 [Dendrobium catenatum]